MKKYYRWILLICLIVLSVYSLSIGVQDFSFKELLSGNQTQASLAIVSRIPRLASILVTGAALSVAGLIMQAITNNKFVSPSTAGTMEWCRFGVMISIALFGSASMGVKVLVAFIVSLLGTMLFLNILRKVKVKDNVLTPLIGMMLGGVVSSITSFVAYRLDIIQNMSSWLQGSFALILKGNYELLYLGIPCLIIAIVYANHFTIAGMGDSFAKNLGLKYDQIIFIGLAIVSIMTSIVVVNVGSLPFIGLIIPNILSIYKGDNVKSNVIDCALLGSFFVLVCDLFSRLVLYPYELPISVVVSVVGSIVFLYLIVRKKR